MAGFWQKLQQNILLHKYKHGPVSDLWHFTASQTFSTREAWKPSVCHSKIYQKHSLKRSPQWGWDSKPCLQYVEVQISNIVRFDKHSHFLCITIFTLFLPQSLICALGGDWSLQPLSQQCESLSFYWFQDVLKWQLSENRATPTKG